jgi:hypothetical protein
VTFKAPSGYSPRLAKALHEDFRPRRTNALAYFTQAEKVLKHFAREKEKGMLKKKQL